MSEDGSQLAAELEEMVASLWWRAHREVATGITRTSASILRRVQEAGPQRVTALATGEPVAQPTMSTIVKRLEQRGLVTRQADPADRRVSLVAITPAGEEMLRLRSSQRTEWFATQLAGLDDEDRRQVSDAVRRLLSVLG